MLVGFFCAKLDELTASGVRESEIGPLVEGFHLAVDARLFAAHLQEAKAEPVAQLGIVLELVVARIALDYTSPRYRELFGEFSTGLRIRAHSSIGELGRRYAEAYFTHYAPAISNSEHILEHYLVSYAYKNLFPFGQGSAADQYVILASYFAMIRTLAVGLAAQYGSSFGKMHLVGAIQVSARSLEHCVTFPARVLEILASKGIRGPAAMSVLTQELHQPTFALKATA
jgi:hypothetical protein